MKFPLIIIIYLLHPICCEKDNMNHSLIKYLDSQAKIVGEKLIRHTRNQENLYKVKFHYINNIELIGNYSSGEIFTIFNSSYALMGQHLYKITQNNYTLINKFLFIEETKFVKTTEFKNLGIILFVSKHDLLYIYGFDNNNEKIFKMQNIVHYNISDVTFFKNRENLYLIVSNYKNADATFTILYKFINSHFDEIEKISVSSPIKLCTFHNNGKEIIIILQELQLTSVLYEFENDKIKKIQKIDTKHPREILKYSYKGKQYIMIFDITNKVYIYLWTGSDLLFWDEITVDAITEKKRSFYVDNQSFLVTSKNDRLMIFSLSNNQIKLIFSSEFGKNITKIWDYEIVANHGNLTTIVILGPTVDGYVEINSLSIIVEINVPDQNIIKEDKLSKCFLNLEKTVYSFRNKLNTAMNKSFIKFREAQDELSDQEVKKFENLQKRFVIVKNDIQKYIMNRKKLVINNNTIINSLKAHFVKAKNLSFEQINHKKWLPNMWLSYSKIQNITGFVNIKRLRVKHIKINKSRTLFDDLLLARGNQDISGTLSIDNLNAAQIETNVINNIPVGHLYYKSSPVNIQGQKTFLNLNIKNGKIETINQIKSNEVVTKLTNPDQFKHSNNLKIENLWVENINGVNFTDFKISVFRIGITDIIEGNLTFVNLKAKNMTFDTLLKIPNVLTTSTDQHINSSVSISKIFAKNIKTNTINDIDFKQSVATFDDNVINGPVRIDNIKVNNNLEMRGKIDKLFLRLNKAHIIGTNESDLLQRYNGKVTVNGNLILKNFTLGASANITISGREFDAKIDRYWTKTTEQKIPTHFEAKNGISTSHIYTTFINDIFVKDFMVNSTEQKGLTKYYFDNVKIEGNLLLDQNEQHSPDLLRIQKESVKINGTFKIKGHKIYDTLKTENLEIRSLNNIPISDMIISDGSGQSFKNLIVKGNLVSKNLSLDVLNNVSMDWLLKNTLYIDEPNEMEELSFQNISVQNLYVKTLNGVNVTEFILKMKTIDTLDEIKNVYVSGNFTVKNVQNLSTINDLDIDNLLNGGSTKYRNGSISGNIKFSGHVTISDFYVAIVNNIDFPKLSKRFFYKSWNQLIRQPMKFSILKSGNLMTEKVNDIYIGNLVDISLLTSQKIFVSNNLRFKHSISMKNLLAINCSCDIDRALKNLKNPPIQKWEDIIVKGNVTFWDKQAIISQIFENVIINKGNHIINNKITFDNHICANNITTLKNINNINIIELIEDAFLNDPNLNQIVTGKKTFVQLEGENAVVLKNANIAKINNINITEINNNIISKNSIGNVHLKGRKVFFGGLQTKKFKSEFITGIKPNNLVSFTNSSSIPNAVFASINVSKNFNVEFINKMPFDMVLNKRLLKHAKKQTVTANYFFHDVKIDGDISTSQINNIKIENIVFDNKIQIIESWKKFATDLNIVGNMKSEFINGLKLSEIYEKAAIVNENTNFNGTVKLLGPTSINGIIKTKFINDYPMAYMLDTNSNKSLNLEVGQIHQITEKILHFVEKYLNITVRMPTEYLYLEKSMDLQITIANTVNAKIVEIKDDVLIHIGSEENGDFCGLPKICKCPFQQTMQISSEHSINFFMNKGTQRIYSYYDEDIIIHLITNSISTSSYCRTNTTKVINEVSSLTWNTIPRENVTGAFYMHRIFFNGYVSGVEFFTIFGKTYVVIGFYYDPVLDTHNVDCLILRFNDDKTYLEEIQKIPTEGMKTISLIHTAQGVVLIMGNSNVSTKIFRFNSMEEQFQLLRTVPSFGSVIAAGVVLEMESLIILASEHSMLYILKYHEEFDNYYFYQSFHLDYPIFAMSVYYTQGYGISDAYLNVVTNYNKYFIYSFQFIQGWKLESSGELDGIKSLIPFKLDKKSYLFAPSSRLSCLLSLVEHDSD